MSDTWDRIDTLFDRLVDASPAERAQVLDAETADHPELRARLEAMLAAHDREDDVVDQALDSALDGFARSTHGEGRRVGPWSLIRMIGEGGMGSVYLAERADEAYDSHVAVKLIRPLATGSDAARRFRSERQILADLTHPGIARLLDGGETEDGQPYLVMEYVDGLPIDEYCRREALGVQGLLRLFLKVADAVQYAHARLVVHRDLKPGNVLVDGNGEPKLLDFGIAKLLEADDADGRTRTGMRPMTPKYASPEQIRGEPVSTASDVYALGVLLYELLTGRLPYPETTTPRDLEDAILDHEPLPPSEAVTQERGGTTGHRTRRDAVDVDTIVLKALSKDGHRRYESVEQFTEDVRRFLDGLPVRARPDTWTYRASKFVRRNRGAVAGASTTMVTVLLFGIGSAIQAVQLERERDAAEAAREEAEAVTDFLVEVFDATDPNVAQGLDLTARDILGGGSARIREELNDQPAVQGRVARAIGEAYLTLAARDSAVSNLRFAVERTLEGSGPESVAYGAALDRLGRALAESSEFSEAMPYLEQALEVYLGVIGPDAPETAQVWNNIGSAHLDMGQQEEGEAALLESLRIRQAYYGPDDPVTVTSLNNLASMYIDLGRYDDAVEYGTRAVTARREIHGDTPHLNLAVSLNNLASALEHAGRFDEAEPHYLESLEMRLFLLDSDHPSVLTVRNNLAGLYQKSGRAEQSLPVYEEILESYRRGDGGMGMAMTLTNYAVALVRSGRAEEAPPALIESESIIETQTGSENPMLAYPRQTLGDVYLRIGEPEKAEPWYRAALDVRRAALAPDHPSVAFSMAKLGEYYMREGRLEEARPLLEDARDLRLTILPEDHPDRIDSMIDIARLHMRTGENEEARHLLERAIEVGEEARGPDDGQVVIARGYLDDLDGNGS